MKTALEWASELGPPPALPLSLSSDISHRAAVINSIDSFIIPAPTAPDDPRQLHLLTNIEKKKHQDFLIKESATLINDALNGNRLDVLLRLWSGCLAAANTIALGTKDDQNKPTKRAENFNIIDFLASGDPVYLAGVEAAPALKKLRNEYYSFEGVPLDSIVRKYPNEFLIE
jgi:hypothetical protein